MRRTLLIVAAVALACPLVALGHGGAMDECGCHTDRKAGNYHCHRGQFANKIFHDKQELLAYSLPRPPARHPRGRQPGGARTHPPISARDPRPHAHARRNEPRSHAGQHLGYRVRLRVDQDDSPLDFVHGGAEEAADAGARVAGTARDYHLDHLVPLCVGGAPRDARNLWPQPITGRWSTKEKDQLESSVCRIHCENGVRPT